MSARPPFASRAELQARHPNEIAVLAADETTRQVDPARIEAALDDVSTEIRAILGSRYTAAELDRVDDAGAAVLRLFAMDMALFRVAYPPRVTEAIKARYDTAVARLRDMARGVGALTITPSGTTPPIPGQPGEPGGNGSPNEVLISANERLFTRRRFAGGKPRDFGP